MFSISTLSLALLVALCLLLTTSTRAVPDVELPESGSPDYFTILVNGREWFLAGGANFNANGRGYSHGDGSFSIQSATAGVDGADAVGRYKQSTVTYVAKGSSFSVRIGYKQYYWLTSQPGADTGSRPNNTRAIVFTQTYLTAATGTATTRQSTISSFPSFHLPPPNSVDPLGYYQWAAQFFWTNRQAGRFDASADIYGGVETGPVVVFDRAAGTAVMMAPFDQFMDASMSVQSTGGGQEMGYGPLGDVRSVPAGWSMSTILYFDDGGVVNTVSRFGDLMRAVYGKSRETSQNDLVNAYLGYNTDRGATYYVNNAPNKTYEETIYAVHDYSKSLQLPYKYWLTDSRWYQQGRDGGVQTWSPKPEHFSEGFPIVTQRTGWQLVAHNRYWSADTPFAKQNGGQFDWIVQGNSSVPIDVRFWDELFTNRSDWGLSVLFQDWLYTVSDGVDVINEQLGMGDRWLGAMANAAAGHDISIQYCMALARHLFTSLNYRAVTQIRVSNDGMPNDIYKQWQIGESALLAWSLGLSPFKDNFWTTEVQCVNPYYGANCTEPNLHLEGFVASMSTGAVAPGDGVGMANATLIMRSCRSDGLLLKPSRPLSSVDYWYSQQAFTDGGVQWQLQETYTELQGLRWHVLMGVDLEAGSKVLVTPDMLHIDTAQQAYVTYWSDDGFLPHYDSARPFNSASPLQLPTTRLPNFFVYHIAPVLGGALLLYGEQDKWVRLSAQRIRALDWQTQPFVLTVRLMGAPGERVAMEWANVTHPAVVYGAECVVDATGGASLTMYTSGQWSCQQQQAMGVGLGAEAFGRSVTE